MAQTPESKKNGNLMWYYGITLVDFNKLWAKQNGKCAICRKPLVKGKNNASVDHCHNTNKVRGILCGACNLGLGQFKDNASLLKKAINYLKKYE